MVVDIVFKCRLYSHAKHDDIVLTASTEVNKKLRYREDHSASVVLIVCVLYDISWEKIC